MKAWIHFMDWPMRAKMAALLMVASLLPLAIATFINIHEARERLLANTEALLTARGDQLVRELDAFNRGYQRSADRIAHLPSVVEFCQASGADNDRLKPGVLTLLGVWPASDTNIRGVAILDLSGVIKIATEDQLVGKDRSNRIYFQEALRGVAVTSDIYLGGSDVGYTPTIAYAVPVFGSNRKPIGIAVLWVRATALWNVAKASNGLAGPDSFAVLFDHLGIRIAHTYNDDIVFHPGGRLDPATINALVAEGRFGEKTRALLEDIRPFPEQFDRARAESPDQGMFRGLAPVNQKWNYGVARRFETVPWTVFYMIPEQALNAQIALMTRQKIAFMGVITLAALLVGMGVTAMILKPIGALSTATKSIAEGDLAARVRTDHADELGRLGASFNSMAERIEAQATSLQKARDELDLHVRERTAELRDSLRDVGDLKAALDEHAIVAITDPQGKITFVNDKFCAISKYSREELLGQDHRIINSGYHPKEFIRDLWTTITRGKVWHGEIKNRAKDGSFYWVDTTIVPSLNEEGKPRQYVAIRADITERKLAEEASAQLVAIVNSSNDAIIGKDLHSIVTSWNIGAEKIFGYSADEMIGHLITRLIPPDRQEEEKQIIERIKRDETVEHFDTLRVAKDGRLIDISVTVSPIKDKTGKIVGASKVARDITERKRAEQEIRDLNTRLEQRVAERTAELETANKELEAFSYSVSHDLRAPLRAVDGFSQAVLEDYGALLPEEGRHDLQTIRDGAQRMGTLIDDLLTFSRLSRAPLKQQEVNTAKLVSRILDELKSQQKGRQVEIHVKDLPPCHGDPALLNQVWVNLLSNALKYTRHRQPAIVEIGAKPEKDELVYFVRDNGAGFDMRYAHKLFGVFQRLHRADEFEGTGVGLAIVQRVVHRHGGRVWAEAVPDHGATFYFTLKERTPS